MPKMATEGEPDPNDGPEVPDLDRTRPHEETEYTIDDLDLPGRTPTTQAQHRNALWEMVLLLQEHGLATPEELREVYDPTAHNEPQQGLYADREQWCREVGELNLRDLPGVEAPDAAGDCWRFVGVV